MSGTVTFNVNRDDIWTSAMETFHKPNFSPFLRIKVKFADLLGFNEDKTAQCGPRREFLRLLIEHLQTSKLFSGPMTLQHINLDPEGL